jgi:O-antigen ligase
MTIITTFYRIKNINFTDIQNNSPKLNSYLIIALMFCIPLSTAMGSIISGLVLIFFLIHGDYKNQFNIIKSNRVAIASLLFFGLHLVGLIWTFDMEWGLHIVKKEWKFLMLPIFMMYVRSEHVKYYIYAFISAMTISEITSYGIWFELIPAFGDATTVNPTPFMTHITYNPLLAIAIYIIASDTIFNENHSSIKKYIYWIFLFTMTVNMFITGGRSGQIMLLVVIGILSFQYFNVHFFKATAASLIISMSVFFTAYEYSDIFHQRVDLAIENTVNYEQNKTSSVGQRISFAINGFYIFSENPIIGVGTGDLPMEMHKSHKVHTPEVRAPNNPHNMYIMMLVQFGLTGLLSLLWLFYVQIKHALSNSNLTMKRLGIALPILFFVANFGESYLSVHATSLLFAALSAVIYAPYKWKKI